MPVFTTRTSELAERNTISTEKTRRLDPSEAT